MFWDFPFKDSFSSIIGKLKGNPPLAIQLCWISFDLFKNPRGKFCVFGLALKRWRVYSFSTSINQTNLIISDLIISDLIISDLIISYIWSDFFWSDYFLYLIWLNLIWSMQMKELFWSGKKFNNYSLIYVSCDRIIDNLWMWRPQNKKIMIKWLPYGQYWSNQNSSSDKF